MLRFNICPALLHRTNFKLNAQVSNNQSISYNKTKYYRLQKYLIKNINTKIITFKQRKNNFTRPIYYNEIAGLDFRTAMKIFYAFFFIAVILCNYMTSHL